MSTLEVVLEDCRCIPGTCLCLIPKYDPVGNAFRPQSRPSCRCVTPVHLFHEYIEHTSGFNVVLKQIHEGCRFENGRFSISIFANEQAERFFERMKTISCFTGSYKNWRYEFTITPRPARVKYYDDQMTLAEYHTETVVRIFG